MTLPLDNDIFVNVLRETCLSATLQLANSLKTSQSDYDNKNNYNNNNNNNNSDFTNLNSPSLFGRLYKKNEILSKLDINSNFPLLSNLPNGSPPIKFNNSSDEELPIFDHSISNKSKKLQINSKNNKNNNDNNDNNDNNNDLLISDSDVDNESDESDEFDTDSIDTINNNKNIKKLQFQNSNDSLLFNDTSSLLSKKKKIPKTLKSNIKELKSNHRHTISNISKITIEESENEDEDENSNSNSISNSNSTSHNDKDSINSQITDLSLKSTQTKLQILTPIKRPDLGNRSVSLNTLKSNSKYDITSSLNTPNSIKSIPKTPNISLSTSKTQQNSSNKKQNKGLRSLGRFLRSKPFTHHSNSNSISNSNSQNISNNNSNSNLSDNESQDYSDSALIIKKSKDNKNTIFSHSENNLFNDSKSDDFIFDKKLNNSNDSQYISETNSSDINKISKLNNSINDFKKNEIKNETKNDINKGNIPENNITDNNDIISNTSNQNSERDTIDSSDFDDNDSVVDSIESSELADSDYDYFNPPTTLNSSKIEKHLSKINGINDENDESLDSSLLHINRTNNNNSLNNIGNSSVSGIGRSSRGMYHSFDDPDVGDYIDDLDSEDYISDAEDYPNDDSIDYFNGDTPSSNQSDKFNKYSNKNKNKIDKNLIDSKIKLENLPKVNSISKISFVHSRPAIRSISNNGIGLARSLASTRRRQSVGNGIRPNTLLMSDTTNSSIISHSHSNNSNLTNLDSSLSSSRTSNLNSNNARLSNKINTIRGMKSAKSYNNLLNLSFDMENEQKELEREKKRNNSTLTFGKIDLSKQSNNNNNNINSETLEISHYPKVSKLTELIHKKNISLEYYKYVTEQQNINDRILNMKICCPDLQIPYSNSLKLKINSSVTVVELIGYVLYELQHANNKNLDKIHSDPNYWKLYLADDDGEAEDDFGVLDRTRIVESYGADEFVLAKCSELEMKQNEKLTPSPLEKNSTTININNNSNIQQSNLMNINDLTYNSAQNMVQDDYVATLPEELTPISGLTFTNTLPNNNFQQSQLQKKQRLQQLQSQNQNQFVFDDLDSDDDNFISTEKQNQVKKDIKKYTYLKTKLNTGSNKVRFNDKEKDKESKLNKFKTRSKTIQSILHNTADHYQQTQQELFRTGNDNIKNSNMTFGSMLGSSINMNMNNLGTNGIDPNNGNISLQSYNKQNNTYNNRGDIFGYGEETDNNALKYHRWTVWRRQQMSFKNKLPKTLTVDGYQIYLLPFNEFKGSWYESKTYNFDISQILKIKQNPKVPNYFKIIIKKNEEGIVKKYYLEARNAKECREIVDTIKALAKTYSEQM